MASSPNDSEVKAAKLLGARMIIREDAFAVQNSNGGYTRVTEPMKLGHLIRHILGEQSIGHYLIEPVSNTTKMFAFDIDADKGPARDAALAFDPEIWARITALGHSLASMSSEMFGVAPMVSYGGGKGVHVVCPTGGQDPAEKSKVAAELVLHHAGFAPSKGANFWKSAAWPDVEVEVFPKQTSVGAAGFGNLMRLPLGVNKKTGNASYFIPAEVMALGTMDDPVATLEAGTWR